jgi:hypothetical protein
MTFLKKNKNPPAAKKNRIKATVIRVENDPVTYGEEEEQGLLDDDVDEAGESVELL